MERKTLGRRQLVVIVRILYILTTSCRQQELVSTEVSNYFQTTAVSRQGRSHHVNRHLETLHRDTGHSSAHHLALSLLSLSLPCVRPTRSTSCAARPVAIHLQSFYYYSDTPPTHNASAYHTTTRIPLARIGVVSRTPALFFFSFFLSLFIPPPLPSSNHTSQDRNTFRLSHSTNAITLYSPCHLP